MAVATTSRFHDALIAIGGESGRLIAGRDWSETPLGPIEGWPQSLRTALTMLLASPVPIVMLWGEHGVMLYNDAYSVFAGGRHPQLLGSNVREGWSEVADFNDNVMRVGLAGGTLAYKDQELTLFRHGRPEQVFMDLDYSPVLDECGKPAGVIAVVIETTERVEAERRREAAESDLRHALELSPQVPWTANREGRITDFSDRWLQLTGLSRVEALGEGWMQVPHPDDRPAMVEAWTWSVSTGEPYDVEHRIRLASGQYRWMRSRAQPRRDGSNNVVKWYGTTEDVHDRKLAERALQESEARYRQIVEGAEDYAIVRLDDRGVITTWNTGAERLTAFAAGDVIGRPGDLVFTPEDRAAGRPEEEMNRAKEAGRALNERWHMRKDGSRFWGSGLMMRLDANGGSYLKMFRDRTVEHEAEAAMHESAAALAAEVAALGRLQEISTRLVGDAASQALYDEIVKAAADLMGSECASLQMLDATGHLQLLAHHGYDPRSAAYWQTVSASSASTCGIALTTGERVLIPDVEESGLDPDSGDLQSYRWTGMRAVQTTPLLSRSGKPIGMISTHWKRPLTPAERDLKLFDVLARQAADAIERTTAQSELRESEARQAFLLSLSDALRSFSTPAEIVSAAAERVGERFGLSRVFYAEYFGSLMRVEHDYTRGVDSIVGEHDLEAFGPDLLRAYHECPVVKVDDVSADPRFSEEARAGLQARQVAAYLDVVLFEDERWVALLALQSATPRTWTASEEALFREIGDRVRSAIERARAEERLRELNETLERRVDEALAERKLFAHAVETSSAAMLVLGLDYGILAINSANADAIERVYGKRPRAGQNLLELLADKPEHQAQIREYWARAFRGEEFVIVDTFGDEAHERVAFEVRFSALRDRNGNMVGVSQTAYDISERVRAQAELEAAQEALRQSQKMEAMGQLTGGVAHDFNNLLTPIVGSLDMLQRKGLGSEREQRLVAGAMQSAERAKTLVQRLLAFARRQPLQAVPVDVAKLVTGMGELIASTTGPQIKVLVEAAEGLPPAKADPNQLEMALLNLAVNARDAMAEGGGTLRISTTADDVRAGHHTSLQPGPYIRLSVADTGAGMDEGTIARAVEPFFSTKGVGKGTGLGLSMVHGLALQLGGALAIQSRPGLGTNVELWLPRSAASLEAAELTAASSNGPDAHGTALLVDDEELVRLSTADMLSDLGYAVVEATSGEEALRLINNGGRFDLLVTDHLMPGMSGTDLAREVRIAKPGMPILLVSGYAEGGGVDADLPRLTKPFRKDELAASLAQLPISI